MRLLLLNTNPAVSRLIKLSAEKAGYELDEFEDYGLIPLATYDVILIDNEVYDEASLDGVKEHTGCDYIVYICQRGAKKPDTCNVALEKPFLPTDFLVLLDKIKNVIVSHKVEEKEEDVESLQIPQADDEEANAFDIDQINALEDEDEVLPIDLLDEEQEDDLVKEEKAEEFTFDDIDMDDLDSHDDLLGTSTASSDEELKLDDEDELSIDDKDEPTVAEEITTPFEDFDFEDDAKDTMASLETEDEEIDDTEESHEDEIGNPSVLDKDDINEVKQLLDESEEEEEEKEISELALDALDVKSEDDNEAGEFFFEDVTTNEEDEPLEEESTLDLELDGISGLDFEDVTPASDDDEEDMSDADIEEDQKEIIDDFAEVIDEKIEEEKETSLEEEELALFEDDMNPDTPSVGDGIDSLDDLNENLLKEAFGEEIDEINSASEIESEETSAKAEVIRDEIESSIARSISSLAQSDILREALKGMRINISITFDEKE